MSHIEVTVGEATVTMQAVTEARTASGATFPHYDPLALLDATAGALLAVNTPQSVEWAHGIYRMTAKESQ